MKKAILFFILFSFYGCGEKNKTIDFVELNTAEFKTISLSLPDVDQQDSLQKAHDSCMGFSFKANALFVASKEKFFIGNVVNRQSLKIVNTLDDLGITEDNMIRSFSIVTNPCYEKRVLNVPLKTILGKDFNAQFAGVNNTVSKEINDAIAATQNPEMKTGSWIYLDMSYSLKRILDTIQTPKGLLYKKNLLDSSNMILTAAESVTDISFVINASKEISPALQQVLLTKPSVNDSTSRTTLRLSYLNSKQFLLSVNGFFPVIGQFMKAQL